MLGMVADLLALKEDLLALPDLTIKGAGNVEILKEWARPFAVGFGVSDSTVRIFCNLFSSLGLGQHLPLHHYIGWLKEDAVACSSMFLGAVVVGIYNVATVPDERGQGIGGVLTWEPLCGARRMGYRIGILDSSQVDPSVYCRIGFEEYCKTRAYVSVLETNQD